MSTSSLIENASPRWPDSPSSCSSPGKRTNAAWTTRSSANPAESDLVAFATEISGHAFGESAKVVRRSRALEGEVEILRVTANVEEEVQGRAPVVGVDRAIGAPSSSFGQSCVRFAGEWSE